MSEPATKDQKAYLESLKVRVPADLTKDGAASLIAKAKKKGAGSSSRRRKKSGVGRAIKSLLQLLIVLGLIAILGLIFWPMPTPGKGSGGDAAQLRSARKKLVDFDRYRTMDRDYSTSLTETEINAYLQDAVQRNLATEKGMTLRPRVVNVDMQDNALDLTVRAKWSLLPVSYSVRLTPANDGKPVEATPKSAKLGHLPMPPPLSNMIARKMGVMFTGMKAEKKVWNDISALEAKPDGVVIHRTSK